MLGKILKALQVKIKAIEWKIVRFLAGIVGCWCENWLKSGMPVRRRHSSNRMYNRKNSRISYRKYSTNRKEKERERERENAEVCREQNEKSLVPRQSVEISIIRKGAGTDIS